VAYRVLAAQYGTQVGPKGTGTATVPSSSSEDCQTRLFAAMGDLQTFEPPFPQSGPPEQCSCLESI
jgi:hypothetical protein